MARSPSCRVRHYVPEIHSLAVFRRASWRLLGKPNAASWRRTALLGESDEVRWTPDLFAKRLARQFATSEAHSAVGSAPPSRHVTRCSERERTSLPPAAARPGAGCGRLQRWLAPESRSA